jgi:hypothetical protein
MGDMYCPLADLANFREPDKGKVHRMHQPVEKVVVGPVGGPKQGQNTT